MQKKLIRLDLGAGYSRKPGYLRVDLDPDCKPDYLLPADNLTKVRSESVDEVYSAHLLEHFAQDKTFIVLREWYRVLKPGGKLLLKVPDCGAAALAFVEKKISGDDYQRIILGRDPAANPFMQHKNMFWAGKLERFLFVTGYVKVFNQTKKDGRYELFYIAERPVD